MSNCDSVLISCRSSTIGPTKLGELMKEEICTPSAFLGSIVLVCLFVGLTFAIYPGWHVIGTHVLPIHWSDLINAVAAFGSCGAAAIALWIALKQSNKEAKRDMEVARLYASSMIAGLRYTQSQVACAHVKIAFADRASSYAKAFSVSRDYLSSLAKRPSVDELKALTPLPNQCASRIARAFDHIAVAQEKLAVFLSLPEKTFDGVVLVEAYRTSVWGSIKQAVDLLNVALPEIERAAEAGSPLPAPDELHGVTGYDGLLH